MSFGTIDKGTRPTVEVVIEFSGSRGVMVSQKLSRRTLVLHCCGSQYEVYLTKEVRRPKVVVVSHTVTRRGGGTQVIYASGWWQDRLMGGG